MNRFNPRIEAYLDAMLAEPTPNIMMDMVRPKIEAMIYEGLKKREKREEELDKRIFATLLNQLDSSVKNKISEQILPELAGMIESYAGPNVEIQKQLKLKQAVLRDMRGLWSMTRYNAVRLNGTDNITVSEIIKMLPRCRMVQNDSMPCGTADEKMASLRKILNKDNEMYLYAHFINNCI